MLSGFLVMAVNFSGCMSYSDNMLQELPVNKHKTGAAVEVGVSKNFLFRLSGGKLISSAAEGRKLNDKLFSIWLDNGYIKNYTLTTNDNFSGSADYTLTLDGVLKTKFNIGAYYVSTFLVGLIPYTVYSDYDLKYVLKNVKTGREYSANVSDGFSTTWWLFYVFAFPFAHNAEGNTINRLSENLYNDFLKQGAF